MDHCRATATVPARICVLLLLLCFRYNSRDDVDNKLVRLAVSKGVTKLFLALNHEVDDDGILDFCLPPTAPNELRVLTMYPRKTPSRDFFDKIVQVRSPKQILSGKMCPWRLQNSKFFYVLVHFSVVLELPFPTKTITVRINQRRLGNVTKAVLQFRASESDSSDKCSIGDKNSTS